MATSSTGGGPLCGSEKRVKVKFIFCWHEGRREADDKTSELPEIEIESNAPWSALDPEVKRLWPKDGYEQYESPDVVRLISGGKQV